MSRQSDGRVAVVTGGASSIGQACAVRLAADGHRLAIADLEPATETQTIIEQAGGSCLSAPCDISSAESVEAFAAQVQEHYGRCDVLLACAGIYPVAHLSETDWELWRRVMSTNVDSLFHLSKAFVPGMVERGWGRVIAISSTVFHTGTPRFAAYTTSKGAVIGFVRALATEVGDSGVTVNSIAPSLTRTKGTLAGPQGELGWFDQTRELQAIKRTQEPADLVGAVSFFASDDSAFVTGQTLPVDGGLTRV
ncbi:MAG TPA: SDR family oxidoreductase [Solirubrobacteraceae bacterium]|jgi:NAD(P)-dependent dehydrogenase (short-subunit alcohol dehydrogenase family)|nr:SDR family oxidoreductase [Solirubrobacteraceae bacterium]